MTLPASIADIPLAAALLAAGVVAGLIMLLRGGRLLRPALVLLGVLAGIALGLIAAPGWQNFALAGVPAAVLLPIVAGLVGGAVALGVFRLAIACGGAAVCGALGVLGAAIYLGVAEKTPIDPPTRSSLIVAGSLPPALDTTGAFLRGDRERSAILAARDGARSWWNRQSPTTRGTLTVGALAGALLGLVLGALAPSRMGAIVTGLCGAAVVLACGAALWTRLDAPALGAITPGAWLGAWGLLGITGVGVQWASTRTRHAPAAA